MHYTPLTSLQFYNSAAQAQRLGSLQYCHLNRFAATGWRRLLPPLINFQFINMEHVTALTFGGQRRLSTLLSLQPFTISYKPKHSHARTHPAPPPRFEGGQYFGRLHNYSGGNAMQWTGQGHSVLGWVCFVELFFFFLLLSIASSWGQ